MDWMYFSFWRGRWQITISCVSDTQVTREMQKPGMNLLSVFTDTCWLNVSRLFYKTGTDFLHFLHIEVWYYMRITCLYTIFYIPLKNCPSGLVGGTDPSLPWHFAQRQPSKLKCHFNSAQWLVTAGVALSPGYSCMFRTEWCQKDYSPSISHLNRIHLPPLMRYSCG